MLINNKNNFSQAATIHQHEGSSYANLKRVQLLNGSMLHVSQQVDELVSSLETPQVVLQK